MSTNIKEKTYLQVIALLGLIIPCPARFAYGLIMALFLIVFVGLLSLAKWGLQKIETGNTNTFILIVFSVFLILLLKQLLGLYSQVLVITLSFALYFIPISTMPISFIVEKQQLSTIKDFVLVLKETLFAVLKLLGIYLLREVLAYGSISLPTRNGVKVFTFLDNDFAFWATIPGAFVIMASLLAISIFIKRKFHSIGRIK